MSPLTIKIPRVKHQSHALTRCKHDKPRPRRPSAPLPRPAALACPLHTQLRTAISRGLAGAHLLVPSTTKHGVFKSPLLLSHHDASTSSCSSSLHLARPLTSDPPLTCKKSMFDANRYLQSPIDSCAARLIPLLCFPVLLPAQACPV